MWPSKKRILWNLLRYLLNLFFFVGLRIPFCWQQQRKLFNAALIVQSHFNFKWRKSSNKNVYASRCFNVVFLRLFFVFLKMFCFLFIPLRWDLQRKPEKIFKLWSTFKGVDVKIMQISGSIFTTPKKSKVFRKFS